MRRRTLEVNADDESFGPGTDLVLSLFACLLMLTVLSTAKEMTSAKRLYEFVDFDRERPFFGRNDDILTPAARDQLDQAAVQLLSELRRGRVNQLQLLGFASPETRDGSPAERERFNFALSLRRAQTVAHYLYYQGVPYECMQVTGVGRAESGVLGQWLRTSPGRTLAAWDEGRDSENNPDGEAMARERRVEIRGLQIDRSICLTVLDQR